MEFIDLKTQYRRLKPAIDARIQTVLDHGQYILGPEVRELEERLAARIGAKHCISCASGTDALLLAMMALGIGPGDEVVTPPFTFFATGEMIALLGAVSVFADIDPATYNIDPSKIEAAITPAHTRHHASQPIRTARRRWTRSTPSLHATICPSSKTPRKASAPSTTAATPET